MANPPPDPAHQGLHRGSVRGFFVSTGGQGLRLLIASGQIIVLSRLLSPDDFGLFSMTWAVLALLYNTRDMGIAAAVVQRPQATDAFLNAAFWMSAASGLALAAFTALIGLPLSWVYGEPQVFDVALKFTPLFLVGGISSYYQAVMRREMQYVRLNVLLTICQALGTGLAIWMAFAGWGIDSLIAMLVAQEVAAVAMVPLFSRWRPGLPSVRGEGKALMAFGGDLSVFRLLQNLAASMDSIALGLFWDKETVGLYNRASALFATPRRQLLTPFAQVAPTLLSRLQGDPAAFGRTACRLLNAVAYMWFPYLALLAAVPATTLHVVLGAQWLDAAPLLPLLALGELTRLHLMLLNTAETQLGRTRSLRNFGLLSAPLMIVVLVAGASAGLLWMARAYALAQLGVFVLRLIQIHGRTPLRIGDIGKSMAGPLVLGIILTGAFLGGAELAAGLSPILRLGAALVAGLAGLGAYLLLWPQGREDARLLWRLLGSLRGGAR